MILSWAFSGTLKKFPILSFELINNFFRNRGRIRSLQNTYKIHYITLRFQRIIKLIDGDNISSQQEFSGVLTIKFSVIMMHFDVLREPRRMDHLFSKISRLSRVDLSKMNNLKVIENYTGSYKVDVFENFIGIRYGLTINNISCQQAFLLMTCNFTSDYQHWFKQKKW